MRGVSFALAACAGAATLWLLRRRDDRTPAGLLRHVVLFSFKEGAPVDAIVKAFDMFAASIAELLVSYERGVQSSPENLGKGLTHAFTLTFPSAEQRDAYLPHPKHLKFAEEFVKPHVADVCVFDYEVDHEISVVQ